jgi:predicted flap endonuclease-1-like 5' DNA nuclease
MLWLVWQIGILIVLAFAAGVLTGWKVWSGEARSVEADKALADVVNLRRENENLARRLGDAEARAAARTAPDAVKPDQTKAPEAAAKPAAAAKPRSRAKTPAAAPAAAPAAPIIPEATPKSAEPAAAPAASTGEADDLSAIKGLGPKAVASLNEGGITRLAQIAAWSDADIESWDERINGRGRITRDDWVGQAKSLTA